MDFFDAFLLRNEQILRHTIFTLMELARLSRSRNPDLIYPGDIVRIRKKTPFGRGGAHHRNP
jgi:hypothetical protein